ncbi:GlxA family transcriptional regulator [Actinomadura sediminis]|uniref:GlxA family transcriptional regulator n=1 Tax=Actinomadura sediminis TaxID=1038904 RepID=A0ABW3EZL3_9ACTN
MVPDDRHRLAVLVRDGVLPMELGLLHQLFGAARSPDGTPLYDALTCGVEAGPVRTDADFAVTAPHGLDVLAEARTILVPASHVLDEFYPPPNGGAGPPDRHTSPPYGGGPGDERHGSSNGPAGSGDAGPPDRHTSPPYGGGPGDERHGSSGEPAGSGGADPVIEALRAAHARGARIASVCTGAFVLAAAGLLDGLRATTHWLSCDRLADRFPAVRVDPAVLYVDEGRVLTSAGEAAGIDLALHMIRRDHGAAVAADVARRTVVPPHREGGQAQFIARPVPPARGPSTDAARTWALRHLDRPVTLAEMAARASMSVRTFTRRFRDETGMSAAAWLTLQRVERARELLERTDLPVDRVAEHAGFGTGASLRAHMRATLGVSPSAYRATFRGPPGT